MLYLVKFLLYTSTTEVPIGKQAHAICYQSLLYTRTAAVPLEKQALAIFCQIPTILQLRQGFP